MEEEKRENIEVEIDSDNDESNSTETENASLKESEEAKEEESKEKQYYERLLYLTAEFDNYKKRTAREMKDFRKFANESLVKDLLPVVDNLERALDSSDGKGKDGSIATGIELTLREILKILDRFGVKPIEALGKNFDPCFHQAVLQEESSDHAENTVLKEFQKGYMLHDRLIRPSMVVVSKAGAAECEPEKSRG